MTEIQGDPRRAAGAQPGASPARRAARAAALLARLALGLIFLAAGVLKAVDPAEFARQMAGYGLVGAPLAALAAPALIVFETTLAAALLAGFRPRGSALVAAGLLLAFIGIEAHGLARGQTESCGCFGAYAQRTPGQVIGEDLIFLALAAVAFLGAGPRARDSAGAPRRPARAATAAVVATAVLSLGFTIASPSLPLERLVTRLAVGRSVADLGVAGKVPEEGRVLVGLLDLADPGSAAVAERLNALAGRPGGPRVVVLTPSSEEEKAAFLWSALPAFEIHSMDRAVLKRLYRRLPRFFVVESGRVTAVLDGAPPGPEDLISWSPS